MGHGQCSLPRRYPAEVLSFLFAVPLSAISLRPLGIRIFATTTDIPTWLLSFVVVRVMNMTNICVVQSRITSLTDNISFSIPTTGRIPVRTRLP